MGSILLLAGVGLALALIPTPALAPHVPAPDRGPESNNLEWLSTSGSKIVDQEGRTVLLRGFNEEALVQYPDHKPAPLDGGDIVGMLGSAADVVRLPISWSELEPVRGSFNQAYLDQIEADVRMLTTNHLYVIPDMHFYPNWSPTYGGAGAPTWAQFSFLPNTPGWIHQDVLRKNLSPGANAATTYFWASSDWQADYLRAWQMVAERLRNLSGVAGYDLYNEPRPGPIPPPLFEKYFMWPLMARTISAIGHVDPNHLFIVEATLFADLPTWVEPLHTPNVVYSPHFYTGTLVPPEYNGDGTAIAREMRARLAEAAQMGVPIWFGEVGGDQRAPHAQAWATTFLNAADTADAGWAWWQWRQAGSGWGIRSLDGKSYNLAFLPYIARPYLVAAPTGVRAGAGNGLNGALLITVDRGHGPGSVEIAWPSLTQPQPAPLGACLASSSWDGAASRLSLVLDGARPCTITISPTE